ncbi:MAG: NAD(P)-dependent oxidoreductase [Cyclobacteriaceae bacterium]
MNCLIIDEMYPGIDILLKEIGITPDYLPDITRSEIIDIIAQYEGLIVRSKIQVDVELLQKAAKLKFIARAGAGIDNIDEVECKKRGITILNAPEANRDAVGEQTIGMLLTLFNRINLADQQVRRGIWEREGNRGYEIQGKTVGIIGFGNMGKAFAKRLQGFDCTITAYDKYRTGFGDELVKEVTLSELFERTDILSLHVPLTHETNRMIDLQFLEKFNKNIVLLNAARGKVVVLNDLIKALDSGKVTAAALDVLENEKIDKLNEAEQQDFSNLIKRDNVLFTPHIAGWSFESYEKINHVLVKKIAHFVGEL